MHRLRPTVALVLLCGGLAGGCSPPKGVTYHLDPNEEEARHCFRSASAGGWTLETWTNASRYWPGEGVKVGLRLTPSGDEAVPPPTPEVLLRMVRTGDGQVVREVRRRPALREVRRKSLEVVVEEPGRGLSSRFLHPGCGWEGTIPDAFNSDLRTGRRNPGTVAFEQGNYLLEVEVSPADAVRLRVADLPIRIKFLRPD